MYAGFFIFIYEGGDYMREIFENSINSLDGEVSIIFRSLGESTCYDFELDADKVMPAASIIKLPILWSVMQKVQILSPFKMVICLASSMHSTIP